MNYTCWTLIGTNQMYKSIFETNRRKLNMDLVLDEIKELLLIFLGVTMVL